MTGYWLSRGFYYYDKMRTRFLFFNRIRQYNKNRSNRRVEFEKLRLPFLRVRYQPKYRYCNYSCSYCIAGHNNKGILKREWNPDRYDAIIQGIYQLPYKIDLRLGLGGEIFTSEHIMRSVISMTEKEKTHCVNLISNLSLRKDRLTEFLERCDCSKLAMVTSYHPEQVERLEDYLENVRLLKNYDVPVTVVMVALPSAFKEIERMSEVCKGEAIHFFLQPMIGKYNKKRYPKAYTGEERKFLERYFYSEHDYEYMVEMKKPGLCFAGVDFIHIDNIGRCFQCCVSSKYIGNILRGKIRLDEFPAFCPLRRCQCDTQNINLVDFRLKYEHFTLNQHIYIARDRTGDVVKQ